MKLHNRFRHYYLAISIVCVFISSLIIPRAVNHYIGKQGNARLQYIKERFLEEKAASGSMFSLKGVVEVREIPLNQKLSEQVTDTLIEVKQNNAAGLKKLSYKVLEFSTLSNGQNYQVSILYPLSERNYLSGRISVALTAIFAFLVMLLYGLTNQRIKKIWRPFYSSLGSLKKYRIAQAEPLEFEDTDIDEFNDLNEALNALTIRLRKDYLNLKEFTENASHEIQTPLAVIKSKVELFLQFETLSAEELRLLKSINDAASRLSRLNQSLLLLTRIENRQFAGNEIIDLETIIDSQLSEFNELLEMQNIKLRKRYEAPLSVTMNPALGDILIRNLLKNALRYCTGQNEIEITITSSALTIANSGEALSVEPEKIFERFMKNNPASGSLGLGLAIVKKICEIYGFLISYEYLDNYHTFKISFPENAES